LDGNEPVDLTGLHNMNSLLDSLYNQTQLSDYWQHIITLDDVEVMKKALDYVSEDLDLGGDLHIPFDSQQEPELLRDYVTLLNFFELELQNEIKKPYLGLCRDHERERLVELLGYALEGIGYYANDIVERVSPEQRLRMSNVRCNMRGLAAIIKSVAEDNSLIRPENAVLFPSRKQYNSVYTALNHPREADIFEFFDATRYLEELKHNLED
jgi:hypothetical protein